MSQWWSWALAAVGLTGIWITGHRRAAGWLVGLAAQALWLAYALASRQWGFLVTAVAYGAVYARNWWRWHAEANPAGPPPCGDIYAGEHFWLGGGRAGDRCLCGERVWGAPQPPPVG